MKQSKIKSRNHTNKTKRKNNKSLSKHIISLKKRSLSQTGGDPRVNIMPYLKPYGILDPEGKYPNPLNGYDYSDLYFKFSVGRGLEAGKTPWSKMPVYNDREKLFNMIHQNNVVLVISKTGSGKTVLVPKLLLHYFDYNGQIAVTIPKRGLVESAGQFGAITLDVNLGEQVGYVHGNDKNHYNPRYTNLTYMTEGIILAQMTGSDPDLKRYSGLIIDEAHERSTNVDIMLMLLKKLIMRRPDFKLIIMSATVSEKVFSDYFDVQGINFNIFVPNVQETLFPIKDKFQDRQVSKNDSIAQLTRELKEVITRTKGGHVIAFVSTKAEANKLCRDVQKELDESDQKPVCLPFYSGAKEAKDMVDNKINKKLLDTTPYGRVILPATNAVESSITVDGTEFVLDTGLEFKVIFDPVKVAYVRGKTYSTQAQIKQRCGRTGRTNAGYCVRIYNKKQYQHFKEFPDPEITTENFTSIMLDIIGMKITGNLTNSLAMIQEMITPPKKVYLRHAINTLYYLGLMYKDGHLTEIGKAIRKFSKISVELALMILASTSFDCTYEVVVMACMMAEGGLDEWVMEPDEKKTKGRTRAEYLEDMRRWSNEFYNYGDPFILLAIYMEYSQAEDKNKWLRTHGVNKGAMSKLDSKGKGKKGTIDEVFNTLDGLAYYPYMFDEPDNEPLTDIKSGYRSLTQIEDERKYSGNSRSRRQYYGGGLQKMFQKHKQSGGRAQGKKKQNRPDLQKVAKDNNESKAKTIFAKYYMPADGNLPRKPDVTYIEDEILCCLYYAFHRHMGVNLGSKKYKSKISPADGSVKGSCFDVIPELNPPEICLYQTMDIMESDFGKDMSSYRLVTKIDEDLMGEFI